MTRGRWGNYNPEANTNPETNDIPLSTLDPQAVTDPEKIQAALNPDPEAEEKIKSADPNAAMDVVTKETESDSESIEKIEIENINVPGVQTIPIETIDPKAMTETKIDETAIPAADDVAPGMVSAETDALPESVKVSKEPKNEEIGEGKFKVTQSFGLPNKVGTQLRLTAGETVNGADFLKKHLNIGITLGYLKPIEG